MLHLPHQNPLEISSFKVEEFSMREFMLMQGKNAGNPDGLSSILTQQKHKFIFENRGSDYSLSAGGIKREIRLPCSYKTNI